jgi:hypothetical protein
VSVVGEQGHDARLPPASKARVRRPTSSCSLAEFGGGGRFLRSVIRWHDSGECGVEPSDTAYAGRRRASRGQPRSKEGIREPKTGRRGDTCADSGRAGPLMEVWPR